MKTRLFFALETIWNWKDNEQKHLQMNQHNLVHTMQNNNCMHIT